MPNVKNSVVLNASDSPRLSASLKLSTLMATPPDLPCKKPAMPTSPSTVMTKAKCLLNKSTKTLTPPKILCLHQLSWVQSLTGAGKKKESRTVKPTASKTLQLIASLRFSQMMASTVSALEKPAKPTSPSSQRTSSRFISGTSTQTSTKIMTTSLPLRS